MDKRITMVLALLALMFCFAGCKNDDGNGGGGGSASDDDDDSGFDATSIEFTPASGGGAAGDVWLELIEVDLDTNTVQLAVKARGIATIFGLAGELMYDAGVVSLQSGEASAAMSAGGASVLAGAADRGAGGAFGFARERAQSGTVSANDATQIGTLTFRATGAGETEIAFNDERSHVLDDGLETVEVTRWLGGTVVVE
ncbi:MAG: hypothetical protein IT350_03540 [Deltaproteobacteria bacterium]|nr:hypothetical protein [Deltaproteobacteria bacterium]